VKRFDLWKLSVLNVLSNPVRSLLTVLGFAIGVAAILAVLTLGDAGKKQVENEMGRLGIDQIWVTATNEEKLCRETAEQLEHLMGGEAMEIIYLPEKLIDRNGKIKTITVCGCELSYLREAKIEEGRLPGEYEWQADSPFVIAGASLANELGLKTGDRVSLFHRVYQICGVMQAAENVTSVSLDDALIIPLEAAVKISGGGLQEIQLVTPDALSIRSAEKLVRRTLEQSGGRANVSTMEVQMEAAASVIDTFVNVLKWVALVCILVGGIGVMNILLVNVRERRREIGVMKSLGTTPCQICTLFLLEAMTYALIGGICGLILGMLLIHAAGNSMQLSAAAGAGDCAGVFAAALAVGLLFGVLPAFRASMLNCVDALRQD